MVQRSSKSAAMAGVLAGLLAAAVGAYYLHAHRPVPPAGPSHAVAPSAGSARGMVRSRAQAVALLMALPELQAWSERIEQRSGGKVHGALIEYDPAPRVIDGKRYYQLSFVENGADAASRWESFLVPYGDGAILVDDELSDAPLSLARWRAEKNPLQRDGAGD